MGHKWEEVDFNDLEGGDVFTSTDEGNLYKYVMQTRDLNDNIIKAYPDSPEDGEFPLFFSGGNYLRRVEITDEIDRLHTAISVLTDKLHEETEQHKQTRARLIELQEKWEEKRVADQTATVAGPDCCGHCQGVHDAID